jgi:hypothetical protein
MTSLADLWNKRRFAGRDEIVRFRAAVLAIDVRVNGGAGAALPPPQPPRTYKAADALARVENPDIAFRADAGVVTVSRSSNPIEADALLSKPDGLPLASGHRYRIKLSGSYKPAAAPLITPGEVTARIKYHAEGAATLSVALRSLEDPEGEPAESFRTAAKDKGSRDVRLLADPAQTGFSVDVAVADAPVEIEAIELSRDGKVVIAAHAGEPALRTGCAVKPAKSKADPPTLECKPGQRVRVGEPSGYLVVGVRDAGGKRAATATLSLEGGRSIDAAVGDDARVWVGLVGLGSATLEQVEVTELGP